MLLQLGIIKQIFPPCQHYRAEPGFHSALGKHRPFSLWLCERIHPTTLSYCVARSSDLGIIMIIMIIIIIGLRNSQRHSWIKASTHFILYLQRKEKDPDSFRECDGMLSKPPSSFSLSVQHKGRAVLLWKSFRCAPLGRSPPSPRPSERMWDRNPSSNREGKYATFLN